MKYSEAIRLGSMMYPQCIGEMVVEDEGGVRVCANGAAGLALGMNLDALRAESDDTYPDVVYWAAPIWTKINQMACPVEGCDEDCGDDNILGVCAGLNDRHGWTRERIADWLEGSGHDFEIELVMPVERDVEVARRGR